MKRSFATTFATSLALSAMWTALTPAAHAQDYACAAPAHAPLNDAPDLHPLRKFATGEGVTVAVIDTGVAPSPELPRLRAGQDFVDPTSPDPLFDCDSHGTIVAGIIAGRTLGVAPGASVVSIRQTSAHYRSRDETEFAGSLATLAAAIHNAVDEGARVINISVVSCLPPEVAAHVDFGVVEEALARAERQGAVVVAAAGNASDTCGQGFTVVPAHFPTVIAVGARADAHTMASYSVDAPGPAVSADGTVAVALASDGDGWAVGTRGARGEVAPYVGTSFAAPRITGAVALLLERYPHLDPAQVRKIVYAAAEPSGGALDAAALLAHLPPDDVPTHGPIVIEPAASATSAAPGKWWVVAPLAALVALVAAASLVGRRKRRLPA